MLIPKKGKNIKVRERDDEKYSSNDLNYDNYKMEDYKDYCEISKMFEGFYYNHKIDKKNEMKEMNKTKSILFMSIKSGIQKIGTNIEDNNNNNNKHLKEENNLSDDKNKVVLDDDDDEKEEDMKNLLYHNQDNQMIFNFNMNNNNNNKKSKNKEQKKEKKK